MSNKIRMEIRVPSCAYCGTVDGLTADGFTADGFTAGGLTKERVEDDMHHSLEQWMIREGLEDYTLFGAQWIPTTLDAYGIYDVPDYYIKGVELIVRNAIVAIINQQHRIRYAVANAVIELHDTGDMAYVSYRYSLIPDAMTIMGDITVTVNTSLPMIIAPGSLPTITLPEPPQTTPTTTPRNCYVYTLRYPDGTPFYIGKGTGDRLHAHVEGYRRGDDGSIKHRVIRDILRSGLEVDEHIEVGALSDQDALNFESVLISHLQRTHLLVNNGGRMWVEEEHEQVMASLA